MISVKQGLLTMVYLTAVIAIIPVIPHLAPWVLILLGSSFILGLVSEYSGRRLLNDRLATLLSIAFFGLFLLQVSFVNLATPLILFLCQLLAVRLAGSYSGRHILQIFTLTAIILASSSLLTLNMGYLVYLVVLIVFTTAGLVLLSFHETAPDFRFKKREWPVLLKILVLLPLGSLLLMLVLFVILPRTQTPLWDFLNPRAGAQVGLSDKVSPGAISHLAASGEVAFRAEAKQIPATELYWRAIVFDLFDGQSWSRSQHPATETLIDDPSSEINVNIYAEPKNSPFLITLDRTLEASGIRHRKSGDGVFNIPPQGQKKSAYRVRAQYGAKSLLESSPSHYLKVPDSISRRLSEVSKTIAKGKDFAAKRDLLDRFFIAQGLEYAATDLQPSVTPIEHFLFDSKRGYCEYFASAYALLLRLSDIPARLVGGYLGGEFNQLGGYYLIKEDAAHVWVEALDDEGVWHPVDPSRLAINAAELERSHRGFDLQAVKDLLEHKWSRMVLNYDLRQQFNLLRGAIGQIRDIRGLDLKADRSAVYLTIIPVALVGLWLWRRTRPLPERLLRRYRQQLARAAGCEELPEVLGLFDLARLSGHPLCENFALIYGAALYQDRPLTTDEIKQLRETIRALTTLNPPLELTIPPDPMTEVREKTPRHH